jgi:hypothetical protein
MQVKKVKAKVLKYYVSNVLKKATVLIIVQQSVKGFCLDTMDYIASSVEKMDILLVGVQNRMNPRIEVSIHLLLIKHAISKILKQESMFLLYQRGTFHKSVPQEALGSKEKKDLKSDSK